MYRQQDPGAGPNGGLHLIQIQQIAAGVHIHKHGAGPYCADGLSGGKEAEGGGDHLMAGAHLQGPQRQDEGIGATVATHPMGCAHTLSKGVLELGHHLAADVLPGVEHL